MVKCCDGGVGEGEGGRVGGRDEIGGEGGALRV